MPMLADQSHLDPTLGERRGDREPDQTAADDDDFAAQLGLSCCWLS